MTDTVRDSTEARKARGAFFTPVQVTRFMSRWAIRSATDRVLEPSCGDGAFLHAAVERLTELDGRAPVHAYELHPESATAADGLLTALGYPGRVTVADFLASPAKPGFDAVVGNPPYIRFQGFTGDARAAGVAAALAQGVRLSRLASSWAPFVIHSAGHLSPTGRLALVLPAELLAANYAQEVRDYLLRRFRKVSVALIGRQVFPSAQTETVLLLAEGTGSTDHVRFGSVENAAQLHDVVFDTMLQTGAGDRWTTALVPTEAQDELRRLAGREVLVPLSSWGRLSLGAVTGNNRYFTLSPAQATELGLTAGDTVPISPAGSAHLRSLTITQDDHLALGRSGAKTLLFRPEKPSPAAAAYIARGEDLGVHNAYKCRVRTPWWRTPMPAPPDLFFTYMNQATPQLATNPGRLPYLNSVHGLYLASPLADLGDLLALAALNSATALSAEVTGRAYGGGILKMEPREAAKLLVPSAETVKAQSRELNEALPTARGLLATGRLEDARTVVDGVIFGRGLPSSARLDAIRTAQRTLEMRRRLRSRRSAK